jgi:hypothetical protein
MSFMNVKKTRVIFLNGQKRNANKRTKDNSSSSSYLLEGDAGAVSREESIGELGGDSRVHSSLHLSERTEKYEE